MNPELEDRVVAMLRRPRAMKPQTERQLAPHLVEHASRLSTFLMCAPDVLEEYELDIVFGPLFTPTLEERAELSDLLIDAPPAPDAVAGLVKAVCAEVPFSVVLLPDGTEAQLAMHEVMVDRYVRLLRLEAAPNAAVASELRAALPAALWSSAAALCRERGMSAEHHRWFAAFLSHVAAHRQVTRELMQTAGEFIAGQRNLDHATILAAAEALGRATQGTAAYAASGHAYWSPDVAQHHQYRGEGKIDHQRVDESQAEAQRVSALVEEIRTFRFP